jgi:NADPH2:quinone reductase
VTRPPRLAAFLLLCTYLTSRCTYLARPLPTWRNPRVRAAAPIAFVLRSGPRAVPFLRASASLHHGSETCTTQRLLASLVENCRLIELDVGCMRRGGVIMDRVYAAAVRATAFGGPEVLEYTALALDRASKPTGKQVFLRHTVAGVNFIDTYYRTGLYKDSTKTHPISMGKEGAATVLAVGPDADQSLLGERVAFYGVDGSYTTFSVTDESNLFRIPKGVKDDVAAAVMLQGCTAHYLSHDCFKPTEGTIAVVHAAAGGTGLLLTQMLAQRKATVIGVCGSAEKAELSRKVGRATHVIDYSATPDWAAEVKKFAPHGAHVVYDGVGKATWEGSLSVLARRGAMVSFGNASGAVPEFSPLKLTQHGSISLQRPSLFHFMDRESGEADRRVADVFGMCQRGELEVTIGARFMLREARKAHEALESKATTGKLLIDCTE